MISREQFGRQAGFYATSAVHAAGAGRLVDRLEIGAGAVALDIGTGAGHTAHALARRCRYVLASDITPEMLAETQRLAGSLSLSNVGGLYALAEALPCADASLDAVACRLAAHHFRDVVTFCAELARVLKPGGQALLNDTIAPEDDEVAAFVNDIETRRDHSHVEDYKASTWRRLLEGAGLETLVFEARAGASGMELEEWALRAGTAPDDVAYIRRRLENAPPVVVEALGLRRDGETFRWGWHTLTAIVTRA